MNYIILFFYQLFEHQILEEYVILEIHDKMRYK